MTNGQSRNLGVLTSGGDAPGMNAAVRAVVRTALDRGVDVFAIHEGLQGLVEGGNKIRRMDWDSVGGILHQGGTVIGSARSKAFRTREGRRAAARNLVENDIDSLVVIGGDGSLTGANLFRTEWPDLLSELVGEGAIGEDAPRNHPSLAIVGLVGSIDNDMFGTDMTIGADTALHRITEAIDAISSTASSHQRTFVIEVMGRHCGYLALMSALATGAHWVFIPESPPAVDDWAARMAESLKAGRAMGRRSNIVVVAEGAQDRHGNPITSTDVQQALEEGLGDEARVTILGHVQRGGTPSAFDRYLSSVLGHAAVDAVLSSTPDAEPQLIGIRQSAIVRSPLMESVEKTRQMPEVIKAGEYEKAMEMRGGSFSEAFRHLRTLLRAAPHATPEGHRPLRLAIMHGGGPSPGMNTAVRTAVRLGIDHGHTILGVRNGIQGLLAGHLIEMDWMSVDGWVARGGAELGTSRFVPAERDLARLSERIRELKIDGLMMIGGAAGYEAAYRIFRERVEDKSLRIPIVCLPATINNDLPGTQMSVGADTALNSIVGNVDKIKESAVACQRCYVVEVMGHDCGYLALFAGMATGAERVYLPEEPITIADLQIDVAKLVRGFERGKRLALIVRSERADPEMLYDTGFMVRIFEKEGGDLFDVRQAILGHVQQGGRPSPYDRIQATRLAGHCIEFLVEQADRPSPAGSMIGLQNGQVIHTPLDDLPLLMEDGTQRPKQEWWMALRPIAALLSQPEPPARPS